MNKNIILVAIIIAVCASFVSCINITNIAKRGNGVIVTSERTVSEFNRISIGGTATVRFHVSDEFRVVVTVDENLDEYVEIATRGNTLNVGTRSGSFTFTQFLVDVYAPTLSNVSVAGAGRFENAETLIVPTLGISVAGAGRVTGKIESENLSVSIAGSGRVTVLGSSENANINISGSGRFIGSEFITANARVNVSGSGNVEIYATDNLNATVSGSGNIRYQGNPRVESRISGSGRVRRVD